MYTHHCVFVKKTPRLGHVRPDAAHHRSRVNQNLRLYAFEEPFHIGESREVELHAARGEYMVGPSLRQRPSQVRPEEAAATGQENSLCAKI